VSDDEHFDAIVVGSGFGGSVTAFRLAEAGLSVCVLERGKAYPPGSFPRSPYELSRNFWDPSEGLHGMFNVWSFPGLGGIVSSGLGGGSLIYANVLIRKDANTFARDEIEYWPVTYDDLEPHYEQVERMLNAQRYPFDREPYNQTSKTRALQLAAERLGLEWLLPNLAITFANPGEEPTPQVPIRGAPENLHGRPRLTCNLSGECDIGCNYGSKNSLDYNYLSLAKLRHGAEIRTRCEVTELTPRDAGGYRIYYVDHTETPEGEKRSDDLPRHTLTADRLVLAAGTFGSTYLLLKNRANFPRIGPALGTRFCGNGDLLTFLIKALDESTGRPRVLDGGYGPVITSAIRVPAENGRRGHYVEDAGYPQLVSWLVEFANQTPYFRRVGRFLLRRLVARLRRRADPDIGAEISGLLGKAVLSSSSLPLLAMGRDIPDGRFSLTRDGKLTTDWRVDRSRPYFEEVRQTGIGIARALHATFRDNPTWRLSRVVTVHPLGGCPMGRDEREGVVDSFGQVFNYPGLYVADGSVMPGPVGPNPSLTIAALANRFADRILSQV